MFGGDDVGAFVADVGSVMTKFGPAGEELPNCVFETVTGWSEKAAPSEQSSVRMTDEDEDEEEKAEEVLRRGDPRAPSRGARKLRPASRADERTFWAGRELGLGWASRLGDEARVCAPVQFGEVQDWDSVEAVWRFGMLKHLGLETAEHPILVADPLYQSARDRARLCEMLFETFEVPATYFCKSAVLSAFSQGKSTALVVDAGGHQTTVVPVHDGFHLNNPALRTNGVSGRLLDGLLLDLVFSQPRVPLRPVYEVQAERREAEAAAFHQAKAASVAAAKKRKAPSSASAVSAVSSSSSSSSSAASPLSLDVLPSSESFRFWKQLLVVEDLKRSVLRASEAPFDPVAGANVPVLLYTLPDGTQLRLGPQRFQPAEQLFAPQARLPTDVFRCLPELRPGFQGPAAAWAELPQVGNKRSQFSMQAQPEESGARAPAQQGKNKQDFQFSGLANMVFQSIANCDVDLWKDLYSNVVAVGGVSLMSGLTGRLKSELDVLLASGNKSLKTKIVTHNSTRAVREYGPWIGGSILGSLGSMHQMWFSQQEYQENGAQFIAKKCPT